MEKRKLLGYFAFVVLAILVFISFSRLILHGGLSADSSTKTSPVGSAKPALAAPSALGLGSSAESGIPGGEGAVPAGQPPRQGPTLAVPDGKIPPRPKVDFGDLTKKIISAETEVRLDAVKQLGLSGDARAVDLLVKMAADPDPKVRAATLDAFVVLGRQEAQQAAMSVAGKALDDADQEVRMTAYTTLATFSDPTAMTTLLEALKRTQDEDEIRIILNSLNSWEQEAIKLVKDGYPDYPKRVQVYIDEWLLGKNKRKAP